MKTIYKVNHWILFLSFVGLITTSLAAEYFFSKQAIMQSFQFSLSHLGIEISPVDQLYIARIERRVTWDWHFWIGVIFFINICISVFRKRVSGNSKALRNVIFGMMASGFVLFVSGLIMFLRLYFQLDENIFALLKVVHNYSKWIFIILVILHIVLVIKLENSTHRGIISNMFRASIFLVAGISIFSTSNVMADEVDRDKYLKDQNYIDGMMYLEGKKGLNTVIKEISNCPYEKCRKSDITADNILSTIKIEVHKPDYKKAVQSLEQSMLKGNFLAADKLVDFLIKRVNYKSAQPDEFILKLLKDDTGLTYDDYKRLLLQSVDVGFKSKGCTSSFNGAEIYEQGFMSVNKDLEKAKMLYVKASENCLSTSIYHMLSKKKIQ